MTPDINNVIMKWDTPWILSSCVLTGRRDLHEKYGIFMSEKTVS